MEFSYSNPQVLFHGRRIDVLSVEADHPKGGKVRREVVAHPGAVVILPLLDEKTVILIKNQRHVVQKTLWELPAGTLEKNEEPRFCAQRELLEETGYHGEEWIPLLDFFSTPGFCNEKLFVFVAKKLSFHAQKLDETEEIETVPLSFDTILTMIRNHTIEDGKTIAALLYYHTFYISKSLKLRAC